MGLLWCPALDGLLLSLACVHLEAGVSFGVANTEGREGRRLELV